MASWKRSHYFETLKSKRRLSFVQEASNQVVTTMRGEMPDLLDTVPGLENFEVYAGDGHWHEHATHDAAKPRKSGDGNAESKYATGHLYGIDLRRRSLVHLTHCDEITRRKEHDMRALKRLDSEKLRQGTPKGKKVLWIWDKAGIDLNQWYKWKQSKGIYFVSRAKENMNLSEIAPHPWEKENSINIGVEEDGIIVGGSQTMVRYIRYRDPLSDEVFEFITNELTLAPGVVVQLYRMRWDIEKVFDDFKNKLGEQKAWASTSTAKTMQAQFLCITHNLLALHEEYLKKEHALANVPENERRQKRLQKEMDRARKAGKQLPSLYISLSRATQIAVKFIRWLRIHLFRSTPWKLAEANLRGCYAHL